MSHYEDRYQKELTAYIEEGRPVESHVLRIALKGYILADEGLTDFIRGRAPQESFGSLEAYNDWLSTGGLASRSPTVRLRQSDEAQS